MWPSDCVCQGGGGIEDIQKVCVFKVTVLEGLCEKNNTEKIENNRTIKRNMTILWMWLRLHGILSNLGHKVYFLIVVLISFKKVKIDKLIFNNVIVSVNSVLFSFCDDVIQQTKQ
jgi:hypothetical protein